MKKEELIRAIEEIFQENGEKPINYEDIGRFFNVRGETVRYYLNKYHLQENLPDYFITIHKTLTQFDEINEESSYWLGYLMADGCYTLTSNKNSYRLMLECKIEDKEILEKFCDFLEIRKSRITIGHKGNSVALSLADKNFSTSVSNYGIIPNKSHKECHLPSFCENDILFIQYLRGLVDGDGMIHTSVGSRGISFVNNSKIFCEEVKTKLKMILPEPSSVWITECSRKNNSTQPLYQLKIGTGLKNHSNLIFLFNHFYNDSKIILTRKYLKLKELIENL